MDIAKILYSFVYNAKCCYTHKLAFYRGTRAILLPKGQVFHTEDIQVTES